MQQWMWVLVFGAFALHSQAQIFVKPNGAGEGDSWATASDLSTALQKATFGAEIWLSTGVYYPTNCVTCTEADRQKSIVLPDGVTVLGGFRGDEKSSAQRDWKTQKTVFSGDIDRDGSFSNNSFSVVYTNEVTEKTVLDGVTITFGSANGRDSTLEFPSRSGGGWYNGGAGTPAASPTIRNCTFVRNRATAFGGAMYNLGNYGGKCNPQFQNCIFLDNEAAYDGGAMYNNGSFDGECNFKMFNCTFSDNEAGWIVGSGGALFNNGILGICNPEIRNCRFDRNKGSLHGGAVYNQGKSGECSPIFINCLFNRNEAIQAGAVYSLGAKPDGNSGPFITNCTFYGNVAYDFGGALVANGDLDGNSRPVVRNCIFSENSGWKSGDIWYKINGQPVMEHCLVDVDSCIEMLSAYGTGSEVRCGEGMIFNLPPKFVNPDADDFRLKPNSAAIDKGEQSYLPGIATDLVFRPRVLNGNIDLGAYEYDGPPPTHMDTLFATGRDSVIAINWSTLNEIENAGFEVQRSADGVYFGKIGWVDSKGDNPRPTGYFFLDKHFKKGVTYFYRLNRLDTDGCEQLFGRDTALVQPDSVILELFPNPANDYTNLNMYLPENSSEVSLQFCNSLGQVLLMRQEQLPKGWHFLPFDLTSFASGFHFFYLVINGEKYALPLVIARE